MNTIIKDQQIVTDSWQVLREYDQHFTPSLLNDQATIFPLPIWREHRAQLMTQKNCAVWLAPDDSADDLLPDLAQLVLIAIDFPKFSDGRGYSHAALLRQRYHYQGELRAIGDVLRDQLFYMARVGFNSFSVRADTDIHAALKGLSDFSIRYQRSTDQATPLFVQTQRAKQ